MLLLSVSVVWKRLSMVHGAGRIMSRTEAVKTLNLAEEIHKLDH
ncbi:RtcB family protein [Prevotella copri]|uniref:RtcB family protein n=1 Tax=Segatella copri TaxID=165179 RepID=A0A6I2TXD1_9BACT|nr:RtcB family protein [Segatella copri DSM 18205]MST77083.1 RtcB family protein [Segatella copri]UEA43219.1 RtcB family protein [Segatella copri DSM 18205]